jgi:esterase/lipase
LAAALALVILLGPRERVHPARRALRLPDDLDRYLAERERGVPGLVAGTEASIRWLAPTRKRPTARALVYLHGFTATRHEVEPLCDHLARRWRTNVFYPRFAAHGGDGEGFATVAADEWLRDAHEAAEIGARLGRRLILVGCSTGAPLALWLASTRADVDLLVLLSPNFGPADRRARLLLWPWGRRLARAVEGRHTGFQPKNALEARWWTTSYRSEGLVPMEALAEFGRRLDASALRVPTIVLYTGRDTVLDLDRIRARFASLGSPRKALVDVDAPHHVVAGDANAPRAVTRRVERRIADFARAAGIR